MSEERAPLTAAELYDAFDKLINPVRPDPVCWCGARSAITLNREWHCGNGHKLQFDDNGKLIRHDAHENGPGFPGPSPSA